MIRYLVLAYVLVSIALPVLVAAWVGLIRMASKVHDHLQPRPHLDLDHEQREMLAGLERLWKLPAYREGRVR